MKTTLDSAALHLLWRFLDARFDLLCEYIADAETTDGPGLDPRSEGVRAQARALCADVHQVERWSHVPAGLRPRIHDLIRTARRLWEREGMEFPLVRDHVALYCPADLREWVLREAYRDHPVVQDVMQMGSGQVVAVVDHLELVRWPTPDRAETGTGEDVVVLLHSPEGNGRFA